MPAANTSEITFGATAMAIQRNPTASNPTENLAYSHIVSVIPVKIQTRPLSTSPDYYNWKYRFDNIIVVQVELANGDYFRFDIQEISNQATWTANLAGQQQCVTDIVAQL
jgi:hypothetical protein